MDSIVKKGSEKSRPNAKKRRSAKKRTEKKSLDESSGKSSLDRFAADQSSKLRMRIEKAIRSIPRGKVSTYGAVARAAGILRGARQVARVLHRGFDLPWPRVLGAGGEIKLRGDHAIEQRLRLEAEGVRFRGRKVNMKVHEYKFEKKRSA
jgi:methylated-DNA-protein-cysteine methyltransferase-like protein